MLLLALFLSAYLSAPYISHLSEWPTSLKSTFISFYFILTDPLPAGTITVELPTGQKQASLLLQHVGIPTDSQQALVVACITVRTKDGIILCYWHYNNSYVANFLASLNSDQGSGILRVWQSCCPKRIFILGQKSIMKHKFIIKDDKNNIFLYFSSTVSMRKSKRALTLFGNCFNAVTKEKDDKNPQGTD